MFFIAVFAVRRKAFEKYVSSIKTRLARGSISEPNARTDARGRHEGKTKKRGRQRRKGFLRSIKDECPTSIGSLNKQQFPFVIGYKHRQAVPHTSFPSSQSSFACYSPALPYSPVTISYPRTSDLYSGRLSLLIFRLFPPLVFIRHESVFSLASSLASSLSERARPVLGLLLPAR